MDIHGLSQFDDEGMFDPFAGSNTPTETLPRPQVIAAPPVPAAPKEPDSRREELMMDMFDALVAETVDIVLGAGTRFRVRVEMCQVDETAVVLLYDNQAYDIQLEPSQILSILRGDEELHVVYAGGKVPLGRLTLLSFIRGLPRAEDD